MTFVPGFSNSFFGKNHSNEMLSFPKNDIISTFYLFIGKKDFLNCLVFNPHMVATLCSDRLVGKIVIAHLLMNTHHDNISKKCHGFLSTSKQNSFTSLKKFWRLPPQTLGGVQTALFCFCVFFFNVEGRDEFRGKKTHQNNRKSKMPAF